MSEGYAFAYFVSYQLSIGNICLKLFQKPLKANLKCIKHYCDRTFQNTCMIKCMFPFEM